MKLDILSYVGLGILYYGIFEIKWKFHITMHQLINEDNISQFVCFDCNIIGSHMSLTSGCAHTTQARYIFGLSLALVSLKYELKTQYGIL